MRFLKNGFAIIFAIMVMTSGIVVHAEGLSSNKDMCHHEKILAEKVKNFINVFESIEMKSKDKMNQIRAMSSLNALDGEHSYLNMVSLLFDRNEMLSRYADNDYTEYKKRIKYEFGDYLENGMYSFLSVSVTKTWQYDFTDIESGAIDDYRFVFQYDERDNAWKIDNIEGMSNIVIDLRLKEMGDQITKKEKEQYLCLVEKEVKAEKNAHTKQNDFKLLSPSRSYSTSNATAYAITYALTPNSSYADFTNYGGDCTNFISQCLYAGGKSMHYGTAYNGNCWYYNTSTDRSSTWTGASQFRNYVLGSYSQLNMSTSSWENVVNGDIIQLLSSGSAYHSLIITGVAYSSYGRSDLLVCAHTTNRRHVSLLSYYSGPTKSYYHVN